MSVNYRLHPAKVNKTQLLATTWTMASVATVFFIARMVVRIKYSRAVFVDDALACFALVCLIANAIVITLMCPMMYATLQLASLGLGRRANLFDDVILYMRYQFSSTLLFWTCIWLVKASFLAFFKRLTLNLKAHTIAWWVIAGLTIAGYAGSVISYPLSCSSFNDALACEHPYNIRIAIISLRLSTALDIATDALIIALPMSLAWRVRLPFRTRLALSGVFALGGFIVLFAIIRVIVTDTKTSRPEVSWLNLWSAIESSIAVIVCNLAPFKTLFTGRMAAYTSNPYQYNRQYPRREKQSSTNQLSSSPKSHAQSHSRSLSHSQSPMTRDGAEPGERTPGRDDVGRSKSRRAGGVYPKRGLHTHVSSIPLTDRPQEHRQGAIIVTREVNRREIPADQLTIDTERSIGEKEGARTMWTDQQSVESAEMILPSTHSSSHVHNR